MPADLQTYADFRPTQFDSHIELDGREDWLVAPVSRTRDSGCLDESNFAVALQSLGGESETVEVHRFGHWGPGWFEIVLVHPSREKEVRDMVAALADYPVLSDEDFSERETEEANRVWADCYSVKERLAYIRDNREQFDFRDFADLLGCVRGKYFAGYASELIS